MAEWRAVGQENMLEDGQMTEATVQGRLLLVARIEGSYYATDALCPHLQGHLARGRLEGSIVICPRHGSQFDLRDGRNVAWIPGIPGLARTIASSVKKPRGLQTYPTRLDDGQVWVQTE